MAGYNPCYFIAKVHDTHVGIIRTKDGLYAGRVYYDCHWLPVDDTVGNYYASQRDATLVLVQRYGKLDGLPHGAK